MYQKVCYILSLKLSARSDQCVLFFHLKESFFRTLQIQLLHDFLHKLVFWGRNQSSVFFGQINAICIIFLLLLDVNCSETIQMAMLLTDISCLPLTDPLNLISPHFPKGPSRRCHRNAFLLRSAMFLKGSHCADLSPACVAIDSILLCVITPVYSTRQKSSDLIRLKQSYAFPCPV